jgi:hypothetical protein
VERGWVSEVSERGWVLSVNGPVLAWSSEADVSSLGRASIKEGRYQLFASY